MGPDPLPPASYLTPVPGTYNSDAPCPLALLPAPCHLPGTGIRCQCQGPRDQEADKGRAGVAVGTDRGHGSTLTATRHDQGVNDLGSRDQGLRDMGQDPLPPASYMPPVPSTCQVSKFSKFSKLSEASKV